MAEGFSGDFERILDKYKNHKLNTYKILELVGNDYSFNGINKKDGDNLYATLVNCGTQLNFIKTNENGKGVYHLTWANFCRKRICPMCQFRRSEKLFVQMYNVVQRLEDNYRFIHLVLTIPNCDGGLELIQGIKDLYKGFNKFYNYAEVKRAFKGCLRCLEVSYNYDNDTFHPHLHCLVAVNYSYFNDSRIYLSYDRVRELWSRAQGSEKQLQIYLRACKIGDYEGVAEVCKYSVKPLDLSKGENDNQNLRIILTLWQTLKGTRFLQKYGIIKEMFSELYGDSADSEYFDEIKKGHHKSMYITWDDSNYKYKKGD